MAYLNFAATFTSNRSVRFADAAPPAAADRASIALLTFQQIDLQADVFNTTPIVVSTAPGGPGITLGPGGVGKITLGPFASTPLRLADLYGSGLGVVRVTGVTGGLGGDPRAAADLPAAHRTTHETGGSDAITSLNADVLTGGTLPDARLPTNVPRLDRVNVFTGHDGAGNGRQEFEGANTSGLVLRNLGGPLGRKNFQITTGYNGYLLLRGLDDAMTTANPSVIITPTGAIAERERLVPMGEWQAYTPTFGNLTFGPLSVGDGIFQGAYSLIGRTCFFSVRLEFGTGADPGPANGGLYYVTGPFARDPATFEQSIPAFASLGTFMGLGGHWVGSQELGFWLLEGGTAKRTWSKDSPVPIGPGVSVYVNGQYYI
jgi:hypothetical protein